MGCLYFGLRLCLYVGVNRWSDLIYFINRGWLGFLVGIFGLLQWRHFWTVYFFQNLVELFLYPSARTHFGRRFDHQLERPIVMLFGLIQPACFEACQSFLMFFLNISK